MSEAASLATERRCAERVEACFPFTVARLGGEPIGAEVVNISATGMLVRSARELAIWSTMTATLPGAGLRDIRVVRRADDCFGCLFQAPLDGTELDSVLTSDEALAGFERLRAAVEAPPPSPPGRLKRFWRR